MAVLVAAIALSGACESLPDVASNVCGNHVIEPGEDCDGAPIGASACSSTCRLECATGAEPCPAGWGCGDDGLCRQPTGAFDTLGGGLPIGADQLTLADFDGDGRRDVLATEGSSVSIAYLDQHGLQPQYTTLDLTPIDAYVDRPGVGDLDGTGRADLALRVGRDLGVLRGQTDRTLLAEAFNRDPGLGLSADEVAYALDVDPQAPGAEIVAVGRTGLRVVRTLGTLPPGPLFTWSSSKTLAGPPAIFTPVSYSVASGEGDVPSIALGFAGDDHITVLPTFVPVVTTIGGTSTTTFVWNVTSGAATQKATVITLPSGATVSGPVFPFPLSEYNGDLVIAGTAGGVPRTYLTIYGPASNAGGGSLVYSGGTAPTCTCESCESCYSYGSPSQQCCGSAACCAASGFDWLTACCNGNAGSPANTAAPFDLSVGATGVSVGAPLFAGPIEGITGDVVASAAGLYLTSCAESRLLDCITAASSGSGLTLAVEQVGGPAGGAAWTTVKPFSRGLLATTSAAGLTYFVEESGAFNPFQIPTQSPVTNLTTGDFNGDGAPDVLFGQVSARATAANPTLQSLQVAFADAFSIPGTPVDLGDIGRASWVLAEADLASGTGISNAIVKLAGGTTPYDVFAGSTDGQLQSPFVLLGAGASGGAPCAGSPVGVARYSAIGRFGGHGGGSAVATLYRVGSGPPYRYEIHSIAPTEGVADTATLCKASLASPPLSMPGEDAFALLPVDLTGAGIDALLILPIGGSKLYVATADSTGWTLSTVDLGGPFVGMTAASIGAGAAKAQTLSDVVLWSKTGVTVLWNDGTGSLAASNAASVSIPASTCPRSGDVAPSVSPNGVAAMSLRGAQRSLVLVTATDTLVASLSSATARTFGAPTCATTTFGGGGRAIAAGDVNGDGVDDFVVARPGGLQVFVGIPVLQ